MYEQEPDVPRELLELDNVVLAAAHRLRDRAARDGMARLAARNVVAVLDGRDPVTPV